MPKQHCPLIQSRAGRELPAMGQRQNQQYPPAKKGSCCCLCFPPPNHSPCGLLRGDRPPRQCRWLRQYKTLSRWAVYFNSSAICSFIYRTKITIILKVNFQILNEWGKFYEWKWSIIWWFIYELRFPTISLETDKTGAKTIGYVWIICFLALFYGTKFVGCQTVL